MHNRTLCIGVFLILMASNASVPALGPVGEQEDTFESVVASPVAHEQSAEQAYGELPLYFEPNEGQDHPDVAFKTRTPGYTFFLTSTEAVFVLQPSGALDGPDASDLPMEPPVPLEQADIGAAGKTIRMGFKDAAPDPSITALDPHQGRSNYLIGNDPSQWTTDVPHYGRVLVEDLWPGIHAVFYGTDEKAVQFDFLVDPGADPDRVRLVFEGTETTITEDGALALTDEGNGLMQLPAPYTYQDVREGPIEIESAFKMLEGDEVGFHVDEYDAARQLVIDPVALAYSTYLGGTGDDNGHGIAVDELGSAYVTGNTKSPDFPTFLPYQPSPVGSTNVFVSKLNPTGNTLLYSTYLGGSNLDWGHGVAVDADGHAYVTGATASQDFPIQNAFQGTNAGNWDVFVTKLSPLGDALEYSTYIGGSSTEAAYGIALDDAENAYVTGEVWSPDYPVVNPFQSAKPGNGAVFITKLNTLGDALEYSTYLGGAGVEMARAIAVDVSGFAYVTGITVSSNFPTKNAFQSSHNGLPFTDAFVTKLSSAGDDLVYSTYLGGSGIDWAFAVAVDGGDNAYVTGYTRSTDFPVQGAYQSSRAGSQDAFVTKIDPAGDALGYSTYLGGTGSDLAYGIAVDFDDSAHVVGVTGSSDFPTKEAYQSSLAGGPDAFVTKLKPNGAGLDYSTYLGGNMTDVARGVAVDLEGDTYLTGWTDAQDYPTTLGAFAQNQPGGQSAFVTKLAPPEPIELVYSTFVAGTDNVRDLARAIAVDSLGHAYITGTADSTDFPTSPGAFQPTLPGIRSAFVSKLTPLGDALLYSTYIGGTGEDVGMGIAVDPLGHAYLTGWTSSVDFPTSAGALIGAYPGGAHSGFATRLDPSGLLTPGLAYSTYLGGSGNDVGRGIAVDLLGHAHMTGLTFSTDFPTTSAAYQTANPGGSSVFVTKLDPAGGLNSLSGAYSSYLGSAGTNQGQAIVLDSDGAIYVAGYTGSGFPTTAGAYLTGYPGKNPGFVSKLDPGQIGAASLVYSTYFILNSHASTHAKGIVAIAVDDSGQAYITGPAREELVTTPDAFQGSFPGGLTSAFLAKFSPDGSSLLYSTFLGGSGADAGRAIALDDQGLVYVAGSTGSANFPQKNELQNQGPGGSRTFLALIDPSQAGTNGVLYSTTIGGYGKLNPEHGVTVDLFGHPYVTGSGREGYPTTPGAFMENHPQPGLGKAFVTKLEAWP